MESTKDLQHVKELGTTTTSERDCTVRTAGLDPDPIGDSGTFLVVGTVAPTLPSPSTHQTEGSASLEGFWLNQEDYNHELSCSIILTHWRHAANWNQPIISSDEGDIDFSNRVIPNLPDLDIRALFEGFRSNHKELSYKSTWYVFLIHQRSSGNWIRTKPKSDEKVIQFLNRWILLLPYLAPYGFMGLQTYQWRPGDYDIHLEAFYNILRCTNMHWIRRIPSQGDLPYIDVFTLGAINHQRLIPLCCCVLEIYPLNLDVPRHHNFLPKLSRYKKIPHFPHSDHLEEIGERANQITLILIQAN